MGKLSQYEQGYRDGMARTAKVAKEEGIEGVERELKFRRITNLDPPVNMKELDKMTERLRDVVFTSLQIAYASVLHDTFGFGEERQKRVFKSINKMAAYLDNGWMSWLDMVEELRKNPKLPIRVFEMSEEQLKEVFYRHPEPEDVYTEKDLVDSYAWKKLLQYLHFTEDTTLEKGETWILDENGNKLIGYGSKFEQIQAYDTLYGYSLAKDHYGLD